MREREWVQLLAELKEFGSFTTAEQRYIRRSLETARGLDIAVDRVRGIAEAARSGRQAQLYGEIEQIRTLIPEDIEPEESLALLQHLIRLAAFDLTQGKLTSFAAFRFLYERLIGPEVRPWLVSAYCAAAALPCVHPELRKQLLVSLDASAIAANGWSIREPVFVPEWVEKVPPALCR